MERGSRNTISLATARESSAPKVMQVWRFVVPVLERRVFRRLIKAGAKAKNPLSQLYVLLIFTSSLSFDLHSLRFFTSFGHSVIRWQSPGS